MAEFKEISPNAPSGEKLLNWVDNRFPLTKLWNDQWGNYYAPKNFASPEEQAKQEIEDATFSKEELHNLPVNLHTQFFNSCDRLAARIQINNHELGSRLQQSQKRVAIGRDFQLHAEMLGGFGHFHLKKQIVHQSFDSSH